MAKFQSLLSYTLLSLVATVYAGIGPVATLVVTDAQISPDGYVRDAIVTNGVFPAPLITGRKVSSMLNSTRTCLLTLPISCRVIASS